MRKKVLLFISTFLFTFISCKGDDNDSSSSIIGKWQLSSYFETNVDIADDCDKQSTISFFSDGKGAFSDVERIIEGGDCETFNDTFVYTISENKITVKSSDENDTEAIISIFSIDGNKLTLFEEGDEQDRQIYIKL